MSIHRRTTAALAVIGVAALAACSSEPKVITSYTPAVGVSGQSDTVKVRNLLLINGESHARVSASVVSSADDAVVGISGQPLAADNSPTGTPFTIQGPSVRLPAATAVNLTDSDLQAPVSGLSDGLLAKVTITFAKSAPVTLTAPVVASNHPDFEKYAPSEAATPQS